jgi:hypothetical protein
MGGGFVENNIDLSSLNSDKLSEYARQLIPPEAKISFLLKGDYNGDNLEEAFIGFTLFEEYGEPQLYVMQIKITKEGQKKARLISTAGFIRSGTG